MDSIITIDEYDAEKRLSYKVASPRNAILSMATWDKMEKFLWAFCLSVVFSGCILPIPHTRTHAPAISGTVISEKTRNPVQNAVVKDVLFGVETTTDQLGRFSLPGVKRWHGAYFVGPISLSLFPSFDVAWPKRSVLIRYGCDRENHVIFEGNVSDGVIIAIDCLNAIEDKSADQAQ